MIFVSTRFGSFKHIFNALFLAGIKGFKRGCISKTPYNIAVTEMRTYERAS